MAEVVEHRQVDASPEVLAVVLCSPEWLRSSALRATHEGRTVGARLEVELRRRPPKLRVGKRVALAAGPPELRRDGVFVPVHWEADGVANLFPVMDAAIDLRALPGGRTSLLFWGRYDPPLGVMGQIVDRVIAHRVAEATVSHLLDALEAHVAGVNADVATSAG